MSFIFDIAVGQMCNNYFNTKMSEVRQVSACEHLWARDFKCRLCGLYNYKTEAIKTTKYATPIHFNLRHYLGSLRKSSAKIIQPREISDETYLLLSSICDKFTFTRQTLALGLYIYQSQHKLSNNQKFWAATALIVAGKAVQLDKYVPYLDRYQRYAEKSFTQHQYQKAQRTIFEAMNFQVQYTTFVNFLDFYLTCGVLFKEDSINKTLVEYFQDDVAMRAREFLKKGTFTKYEPELLALGIIKEIRMKYNLKGWNQHLQELAGYCDEEIAVIVSVKSTPLKEVPHNSQHKLAELKVLGTRKNIENMLQNEKAPPTLQKYSSVTKSVQKQNVHSTLKVLPQAFRKPSNAYLMAQGFNTLALDMLNKRR